MASEASQRGAHFIEGTPPPSCRAAIHLPVRKSFTASLTNADIYQPVCRQKEHVRVAFLESDGLRQGKMRDSKGANSPLDYSPFKREKLSFACTFSKKITSRILITEGYFLPENMRKWRFRRKTCRNIVGKYISCGRFFFTFWYKMLRYTVQELT